jgi:hypothetical protein
MKHDAVFLTHDQSYRVPFKPNTRMVTAMAIGLPVLSTPSGEFERTLKEVGCEEWLVHSPGDMSRALKELGTTDRVAAIARCREYAWKHHAPVDSAKALVRVIQEVGNA